MATPTVSTAGATAPATARQSSAFGDFNFGSLSNFDPLGTTESLVQRPIDRPQDIRFR